MNNNITPTNISADRQTKVLSISWSDGRICKYPFDLLRNACPCAQCRGGHENMTSQPAEDVFTIPLMDVKAARMKKLEAMGSYAINIEWEDGHSYGIYQWEYLLALCDEIV